MNNTFNLQRFGLLLRKTLLERPMQMFGFTGLLLALMLILYVVIKSIISINAAQNGTFIWGLAGGSCFLASFVFSFFSSNAIGSSWLTLPASHFEKWLCGILIVGVLYPLAYLIFFRIMDASFVGLFHKSLDPAAPFYKEQYESVYIFPFDGIIAWKVYPMFLFLTGAMLIGSLYFNKVGFIKVALVVCIVLIGAYGLNWLFAKILFGTISDAGPFSRVSIPVGKEEGTIELPEIASGIFDNILKYVFPGMLWILAFIRLREKEF
ncbi:MAG: hypothetical protein ABIO55_04390 [Ginsengibacter sp.]